ncbi:MAG: hypothetical protein JKX94_12320 [Sneathiella sp.]|nr:hypothetical protein [Sneathiella sp.]
MDKSSPALLKNTLLANAAFSALGGVLCLAANDLLTTFMGMADGLYLYIVGAGLLIFAVDVAYTATRATIKPLSVKMIIGGDVAWVIASFLLVALMPQLFDFYGIVLIEFVALDVAIFAVLQTVGLKRMANTSGQVTA